MQNITDNGYIIPFIIIPRRFTLQTTNPAKFVSQAISKLLRNNCIEELDQKNLTVAIP